jgi:hypothetical protein
MYLTSVMPGTLALKLFPASLRGSQGTRRSTVANLTYLGNQPVVQLPYSIGSIACRPLSATVRAPSSPMACGLRFRNHIYIHCTRVDTVSKRLSCSRAADHTLWKVIFRGWEVRFAVSRMAEGLNGYPGVFRGIG